MSTVAPKGMRTEPVATSATKRRTRSNGQRHGEERICESSSRTAAGLSKTVHRGPRRARARIPRDRATLPSRNESLVRRDGRPARSRCPARRRRLARERARPQRDPDLLGAVRDRGRRRRRGTSRWSSGSNGWATSASTSGRPSRAQFFYGNEVFWIYRRARHARGADRPAELFGLALDAGDGRSSAGAATTGTVAAAPAEDADAWLEPELLAESLRGERADRVRVALDHLPEQVWRAVLAAEDARFFEHPGVDPSPSRARRSTNLRKRRARPGRDRPSRSS